LYNKGYPLYGQRDELDSIPEETMFDCNRVKRFIQWTKKRFKDQTIEQVWGKIKESPKLMHDYEVFDKLPPPYSPALPNIRFAIKSFGWRELMDALWIVASEKEQTMSLLGLKDEEEKWIKVKDKLAQMPKNVQC